MQTTLPEPGALFDKAQRDLSVGTAWLVVLAAIARSSEPIHGYEIARLLTDSSPQGVSIKHGTLYPILRTMESEGLVRSTLIPSNEGPARKCYLLTAAGRVTLDEWSEAWRRTRTWVDGVLGEPPR